MLEKIFKLAQNNTTLSTEIIAGLSLHAIKNRESPMARVECGDDTH